MTSPTGTTRKLSYPLSFSEDVISDTPSDTMEYIDLSQWSTIDPDEKVDIVINLSLNEYVSLANCIDVGRDIAYGDNSIYLWWLWCRVVQSLSLCDSILACVNDPNSGIMQSILEQTSLQTSEQYRANGQSQSGLILGSGVNPSCDLDVLWGGIRSVIDLADTNNVDVLQVIEVVTNPYEFVQEVVLGIFGVELPVIQSIVDWIGWVQDNILENYEAEVTTEYLRVVMCDLFCLTQDSCQLTPETLTNYFYTRLGSSLTIGSLLDETIAFLIGGVWVGTQIADVFFLSQFAFRAQLGKWFRLIGFLSVDTDFRIGANTPDNDWSILCTDCPTLWTSTLDFTTSDYGFVFDETPYTRGEWIDGVGLKPVVNEVNKTNHLLGQLFFDTSTVTSIEIIGNFTRGFTSNASLTAVGVTAGDNEPPDPFNPISGTNESLFYNDFTTGVPTDYDITSNGYEVFASSIQITIRPRLNGTGVANGDATLATMIIQGEGDKPPQLP